MIMVSFAYLINYKLESFTGIIRYSGDYNSTEMIGQKPQKAILSLFGQTFHTFDWRVDDKVVRL